MRVSITEMMEKLGVGYQLSPYETCPWAATDTAEGKTFSGEVRMSPDGQELEAELQMVYDEPRAGQPSVEQLMWMQIAPFTAGVWAIKTVRIKNEIWDNKVYGWEEKSSNLFRAVVSELALGNIPDFDELIEREMRAKERFGDQRGGGAGKSPKIRPGQLLNMKTGF